MKLYSVTTTVKEFSGCKNVVFNWFRHAVPHGLEGCTVIDNGDTYRHRLMIVRRKPDGTIDAHMETNPEAAARERAAQERLIRNGR